MKLLDKLAKIDDRNSLDERHKLPDEDLATYVGAQVAEMQAVIQRMRVDILLNENIAVDGKSEAEARDDKIKQLEKDIAQMSDAVNILAQLGSELTK